MLLGINSNPLPQRFQRRRNRRELFFRELNRFGLLQTVAGEVAYDRVVAADHAGDAEFFAAATEVTVAGSAKMPARSIVGPPFNCGFTSHAL